MTVATVGNAGKDFPTVHTTPEMAEAGYRVLAESGIADDYLEAVKLLVVEIYLAMSALRPD